MNVERSQYVCCLLPITSYGTPAGPAILVFSASLPPILFGSTGLAPGIEAWERVMENE